MPFANRFHRFPAVECGLIFYVDSWVAPVPLKSVDVSARIVDFVAEVTVEQAYVNRESRPIEAVYVFPVEESAAVTAFEAEVEGRTITTKVKAKKEAAQEYSDAVQAGHTAVLLEEDKPDVFTIKIGQLKPGSGAKIRLIYASELPVDEGSVKAVRLTVPTTIAPRFVPYTDGSEAAKKLGGIQYSLDTPAPLKVSILAVMKNKIAALESPSHKLLNEEMKLEDGRFVMESRLRSSCDEMDRDLIVLVTTEVEQRAAFFFEQFEKDGKVTSAGMVSLVPSFRLKESRSELIFVVDRSGSMGGGFSSPGSGIDQAKKALGLFLPSMPADCWFNIYSFGSTFESLFPKSIPYDDTSLATAKAHVAEMTANYGGTVILNPLRAIFKEEHAHKEASRQIFVLTDGSVSNTDEVLALVRANASRCRVFALGLGNSCSRYLVSGLARAGGGTAVFAAAGEDLRPKVLSQLKDALQPAIDDVKVEWIGVPKDLSQAVPEIEKKNTLLGYLKPKKRQVSAVTVTGQAPAHLPPIYDGRRLLAYRLFGELDEGKKPTGVKVTAKSPDGPLTVELPLEKSSILDGSLVHQLAARKRIQDLEESPPVDQDPDDINRAIEELGKTYSLASSQTSFVGVDKTAGDKSWWFGPMMTREVANQVPLGFGGHSMMYSSFQGGPGISLAGVPQTKRKSSGLLKSNSSGSSANYRSRGYSAQAASANPRPPPVFCSSEPVSAEMFDSCSRLVPGTARSRSREGLRLALDGFDGVDIEVEAAPEMAEPSPDLLTSLIDLQSSNGTFRWGPAAEQALGPLALGSQDEFDQEDWLTALICAYFKLKMSTEKELWELVARKARTILMKRANGNKDRVERLERKAEEFVQALEK